MYGRTDVRTYGRLEIHPCVLQDIGPLGPLPWSHSTTSLGHPKQGIGYRWPCAILGWLVWWCHGVLGGGPPLRKLKTAQEQSHLRFVGLCSRWEKDIVCWISQYTILHFLMRHNPFLFRWCHGVLGGGPPFLFPTLHQSLVGLSRSLFRRRILITFPLANHGCILAANPSRNCARTILLLSWDCFQQC